MKRASWPHQRGGGERRDALAAAGEAEPFGGGGLDADPVRRRARRCGRAPARMAAACGPIFGASQTSVQSRWLTAKPRPVARSTALRRKISEAAPFQAGSEGGNHWPMSPSASAPKIASVSACMPTSASEWPTRPRSKGIATPQSVTPGRRGRRRARRSRCRCGCPWPLPAGAGAVEIGGGGDLEVVLVALDQPHLEAGGEGDRGVVERVAGAGAMRGEDRRRSGSPAASAPARGPRAARAPSASPSAPRQSASTTGSAGRAAGEVVERVEDRRDERGRRERAGRVVDQHPVGRGAGRAPRGRPGPSRTGSRRRRPAGSRRGSARPASAASQSARSSGWITTWKQVDAGMGEQGRDRAAQHGRRPSGRYCFGVSPPRRWPRPAATIKPAVRIKASFPTPPGQVLGATAGCYNGSRPPARRVRTGSPDGDFYGRAAASGARACHS